MNVQELKILLINFFLQSIFNSQPVWRFGGSKIPSTIVHPWNYQITIHSCITYQEDPWSQNAPSHQFPAFWAVTQLYQGWIEESLGKCYLAFLSDKLSLYTNGNTCQALYGQLDLLSAVSWLLRWQRPAKIPHEFEDYTPENQFTRFETVLKWWPFYSEYSKSFLDPFPS